MKPAGIRELRRHLRVIEREVEYQLKSQTMCCGVTPAQCHALLELAELDGTSLMVLSERLKLDASTLSRTVDSLVRAGYVDRVVDPDNRRSVRLGLTAEGRQKVDFINDSCDRFYLELLQQVPKGRQSALADSIKRLAELFPRLREVACTSAGATQGVGRKDRRHGR